MVVYIYSALNFSEWKTQSKKLKPCMVSHY